MILVVGSSRDRVYPILLDRLQEAQAEFTTIDEDSDEPIVIETEGCGHASRFRVVGQSCRGELPVACIFVRHAVARTLDPAVTGRLAGVQAAVNRMLFWASCPVVNQPSQAFSNYSKVYQLALLAEAGFDLPETLLTNRPQAVESFVAADPKRELIFKGASNMMTLAQVLSDATRARLAHLPNCPTVFQTRIQGTDVRVHVIGDHWVATRLVANDPDYRRAAFDDHAVEAEPAELPPRLGERCVAVTKALGLRVSGIDFRVESSGRHVALEINPFPQFTFYERLSGQPIMKTLTRYLIDLDRSPAQPRAANVMV